MLNMLFSGKNGFKTSNKKKYSKIWLTWYWGWKNTLEEKNLFFFPFVIATSENLFIYYYISFLYTFLLLYFYRYKWDFEWYVKFTYMSEEKQFSNYYKLGNFSMIWKIKLISLYKTISSCFSGENFSKFFSGRK